MISLLVTPMGTRLPFKVVYPLTADKYTPFRVAFEQLVGPPWSHEYACCAVSSPTATSAPIPIAHCPARFILILPSAKLIGSAGAAEASDRSSLNKTAL